MRSYPVVRSAFSKLFFVLLCLSFAGPIGAQNSQFPTTTSPSQRKSERVQEKPLQLKKVRANGVDLHYVESGKGTTVVFVHGSLDDYRMWQSQIEPFAERYRVIAYSRRYNYPNTNRYIRPDHSAIVEAEDLAALIRKLKLGRVHIVGHSYGALTALFLGVKHPELVRTLVLAEPPVLRWAEEKPEGRTLFNAFIEDTWKPAGDALRRGEKEKALRITLRYFTGDDNLDHIPEAQRKYLMENMNEWQALTTSRDAFPALPRPNVKSMRIPAMMLSGGRSLEILKFVDGELEPLLANGERVVLQTATHEMWAEQPEECRRVVLAFLAKH